MQFIHSNLCNYKYAHFFLFMEFLRDSDFAKHFPDEPSCIQCLRRLRALHSSTECKTCGVLMQLVMTGEKRFFDVMG